MSLINILKRKNKFTLFTTPSHSQNFFIFSKFKQFYKYDISENDAYKPQKALELAQKKAAKIYGTKSTYFLTNGSTSGIIAAVLACVKKDEKVLIWDNAHPSHKNAVTLAGGIPVFYELEKDNDWGIYTQTSPELIESKLKNEKIKAVIITSPTYEGIVSDIAEIKKICSKYGAYLIVDEAHGALYPFCDKLPESAIYQGADFIIQSLHKTAGGLNPTALLHCNIDIDVTTSLNLITTTSPSYPLLASIEKNINFLNSKKGRAKILELIENIENMKKNVTAYHTELRSKPDLNLQSRVGLLSHQQKVNNALNAAVFEFYKGGDLTKILVKSPSLNGFVLSEFLYKHKIEDERTNEKSTMLLCGIGTDLKKLKRLEKVLKKI